MLPNASNPIEKPESALAESQSTVALSVDDLKSLQAELCAAKQLVEISTSSQSVQALRSSERSGLEQYM
jgi:hypothetical protein